MLKSQNLVHFCSGFSKLSDEGKEYILAVTRALMFAQKTLQENLSNAEQDKKTVV